MEINVIAKADGELLASILYNQEIGTVEFIEHDSVRIDINGAEGKTLLRVIEGGKEQNR